MLITRERLRTAYDAGVLVICSPRDIESFDEWGQKYIDDAPDDQTLARIGNYWFYFGGETADSMGPAEYLHCVGIDDAIDEIFETLEDFEKCGDDGLFDEYQYYDAYLEEMGI